MIDIYCYVNNEDNSTLYVGQTKDLDKRMYQHSQRNRTSFDKNIDNYSHRVLVLASTKHQKIADYLEKTFIRRYKPRFNKHSGGINKHIR